jgi:hypothetical protein
MTKEELYEYIKNKPYYCKFCAGLKKDVIKRGLVAIKEYDGMICGGVQDMKIRLSKTEDFEEV